MSMTDQVPAQTRQAASLLPESPRYVGMVDVGTVLQQVADLRGIDLADTVRHSGPPALRRFLETTGIDPGTDVKAAYAALEGEEAFSAVLFGSVTPEQVDQYLEQSPAGAGRATTYRDVPLYHLVFGDEGATSRSRDTLSVAFIGNGTLAVARERARVTAMVDRYRGTDGGLQSNDAYMTLVKRVGRGSTAWLVGREVVESALDDSSEGESQAAADSIDDAPQVNRAGVEQALAEWSDRVLGLSDVSSLEGRAGDKMERLTRKLREQAVSVTLTGDALEGEVYLTMRDDASASSVVNVAEGAVAIMKLSQENLDERHRDLLEEIEISQTGSIVHIQFSLDRQKLRNEELDQQRAAVHGSSLFIHQITATIRRMGSITYISSS